jgi:hypothetical protein
MNTCCTHLGRSAFIVKRCVLPPGIVLTCLTQCPIMYGWQQGTIALSSTCAAPVGADECHAGVSCAAGLSSWSSSAAVYNEVLRRRPDLAQVCSHWGRSSQLRRYYYIPVKERCDGGGWPWLRCAVMGPWGFDQVSAIECYCCTLVNDRQSRQ